MASQVYDADSGEHIDLERLVKNGTSCILIGGDGTINYFINHIDTSKLSRGADRDR